jgi:hypothetical protein
MKLPPEETIAITSEELAISCVRTVPSYIRKLRVVFEILDFVPKNLLER